MHPDVAAIRRAAAWKKIELAFSVLAVDDRQPMLDAFKSPPIPAYEREARDLYRIEAVAALMVAVADDLEPIAVLGIDSDVRERLIDEGYDSLREIEQANDNELLAIEGLGRRTLDEIRAIVPHVPNGQAEAETSQPVDGGESASVSSETEQQPSNPEMANSSPETSGEMPSVSPEVPPASAAPEIPSVSEGDGSDSKSDSEGAASTETEPGAAEATNNPDEQTPSEPSANPPTGRSRKH